MSETNLKLYSLGIVVETKPVGTDYILVSPVEDLNIQTPGNIKDYKKDYDGNKKNLESVNFTTQHESKNYIKAKWLPFGHSNRITAPDVVINETVILFKFADVDEYYWTTIFREPILRRLETVQYAYSNLKDGITKTTFDKESSYWVEYSTKDKYVHLHTAKSDGEPFIYDLKIDTKQGVITVKDDVGNYIQLDSSQDTATVNTNKDINLIAGVNINIKAGSTITLEAPSIIEKCTNKTTTAGSSITTQAPSISTSSENSVSKSSGSMSTEATSITNKASQITNDAPLVSNTGNVETAGSDTAHPNLNAVLG